jgi:hypothetical protein
METKTLLMKALSRSYRKIFHKTFNNNCDSCIWDRTEANRIIGDAIISGKPFMLSRFGSIELSVANTVRMRDLDEPLFVKLWRYVVDNTDLPWMDEKFYRPIALNAGVFNPTPEILNRFGARYVEDSRLIDVLMSINYKETQMPLPTQCKFIHFETAYPFFVANPWTRHLEGKKVLVVHPFVETIRQQYKIKEKLFENHEILPDFELKTIKAIQSSGNNPVPFKDWFDALKSMEDEIDNTDYDICLIGAGAYGLPLAAHVKRSGKQSIHMGAGVQLLFGIKGGRWEDPNYGSIWPQIDTNYTVLFNEYWTRPLKVETPKDAMKIEGACYW